MIKNKLSLFFGVFSLISLSSYQMYVIASEVTLPEPLTPQLSADVSTLYNGIPLRAVVNDPNPPLFPRHIPPPPALTAAPEAATASFSITYVADGGTDLWGEACYEFPAAAKTAFDAAANIWANTLDSSVPITIRACWASFAGTVLGYSGGGPLHGNFSGATRSFTWYSGSLANALSGTDQSSASFDMHITYNGNFSWYYGTDGNTPGSQHDLMSVVLHEIAHGLNFSGSMSYSGGVGSWGYGTAYPNIYDVFMRDGSGMDLTAYTNGSTALGSALTSNDIWFNGSWAIGANGDQRVRMYAPSSWSGGSSYSHLDYATFNDTSNQLMVYAIGAGESIHDPGVITRGLLTDLGWDPCSGSKTLSNNQWVMFSLACNPGLDRNTVADVFDGLVVGDYDTTWVVYEQDAATDTYIKKAIGDTLVDRKGYWFYTTGTDYALNLAGAANSGDYPLEADVAGRWNLIGHPFTNTIPWGNVRVVDGGSLLTLDQADPDLGDGSLACDAEPVDSSCLMSRKMQQWNGAAFQAFDGATPLLEGSLQSFDALWVKVYEPGLSLYIPPETTVEAAAVAQAVVSEGGAQENTTARSVRKGYLRTKSANKMIEPWFLRLTVESGELKDPGNALGQLADSIDGQDSHDLEELSPFGSTYLSIVFPHRDWSPDAWGFTSDYRALTKKPKGVWSFEVRASSDIEEATLRWDGPEYILRRARLVDEDTGRTLKMKPDGSYSFYIRAGINPFRFELR